MAVKRIRVANSCTADIEREMTFMSQLAHNHIIQCFGVDRDANYVYIITDYAEGGNLKEAAPRLDWEDKKRIVVEVARGLAYLHSQDIIHRDIKGENILLTKSREAKLCDFGIAKITASATCACSFERRQTKEGKGTRGSMAPELFRARPAYSDKSDVYALGVVMRELVCGGETPLDYMAIMKRCLDEDPEKRPSVQQIVGAFHVVPRVHDLDIEGDQVTIEQTLSADEEFHMGMRFLSGVDVNLAAAVDMFMRSASKGHTIAQTIVGISYQLGVGVLRDYTKVVKWLQMAADKDFAPAQAMLGEIFLVGEMGVSQDCSRALDLLQAAANQGYVGACIKLGAMNATGEHVEQNDEEAVRWFRKAADGGSTLAQAFVGHMYYEGYCVEKDYAESMKFVLKAASQGQVPAYMILADMYYFGRGVPLDRKKAVDWWRKAAEQGDMDAQYNIGLRLILGKGICEDMNEGLIWLNKASNQGHERARILLEAVHQGLLTP
ncbi:hypothetical protein BGZ83_005503 [Gryganskiella cystojenkinii]|nr:hypothetical protein BGZ83_005503 [Gryganskiella cystojenkinii]